MKKSAVAVGLFLLIACMGCGEDDMSAKVIGIWHFPGEDIVYNEPKDIFVEITKTQITITDFPTVDIAMSTKDGKVVLRHAGKDEVFLVVGVIDDNTLEIDFGYFYGRQRLKRISAAERDSLVAKAETTASPKKPIEEEEESSEKPSIPQAYMLYSFAQMSYAMADAQTLVGITGEKTQYCNNFRNLCYGFRGVLPREIADAFAGPAAGMPTVDGAAATATPYAGYLFLEDPGITDWNKSWGLIAYPVQYNRTGKDILCLNEEGVGVMNQEKRAGGLPKDGEMPRLLTANESIVNNPDLWDM